MLYEVITIEAALTIRELLGKRPYICAVSAHALQENKTQCLQAGMNDFLSKPIRLRELIAVLKGCPAQANHPMNI